MTPQTTPTCWTTVASLLFAHSVLTAQTPSGVVAAKSPSSADQLKANEVVELAAFTVAASSNVGYGANLGTSGRLAVPYAETPQAISIVTSQLLADATLFSSDEALKFVPAAKGNSTLQHQQSLRGLVTSRTYTDGLPNGAGSVFDTFFTERIEVVKGPSAAAVGSGDPAGFVNYVSKRPTFRNGTDVGQLVGTGNGEQNTYRTTIDRNGFLSDNQRTAYRFLALYSEGAQSMELSSYKRAGMQVSIAHRTQDRRGRLDVVSSYLEQSDPGSRFDSIFTNQYSFDAFKKRLKQVNNIDLPPLTILPADSNMSFSNASLDRSLFRLAALVDYRLSDRWAMRHAASVYSSHLDGMHGVANGNPYIASDGILMIPGRNVAWYDRTTIRTYQADVHGAFDIAPLGGQLSVLAGGDVNSSNVVNANLRTSTATIQQKFYNWNPAISPGPLLQNPGDVALASNGRTWSAYAQAQLKVWKERLQLSAAARRIWQDSRTTNRANAAITDNKQHTPEQPTVSLLIKPVKGLSFYGTYSKYLEPAVVSAKYSLIPQFLAAQLQNATHTMQPQTTLKEVGVKSSLLDGNLTFAVSYYDLQSGGGSGGVIQHFVTDPGSGNNIFYLETFRASARVSGWEFEGFGRLQERLSFVVGGNVATESNQKIPFNNRIVDALIYNVGDSAYAFASYRFGADAGNGWSVSGGWKTYFSGWGLAVADPGRHTYPEDITLFDLAISYRFMSKYDVFIKGTNILHKDALPLGDQSRTSGRLVFFGINARL